MSAPSNLSAPAKWLADELSALLSSPYSIGGLQVADSGSTDPFSASFNGLFMRHARGIVGGREVDREELKQILLALQTKWPGGSESFTFEDCIELHRRIDGFHPEMGVKMEFVPTHSLAPHILTCEACVAKQKGVQRIKVLMLDGDPSLFQA